MKPHARFAAKAYGTIALTTPYWRPGQDFIKQIINALEGNVRNGDIVTVSEKAISTASSNIIDESIIHHSLLARFLVRYWMRIGWGHVLGRLCHLREKTIERFRTYPVEEGGKHKQLALHYSGFLQALMHGSEGGIDGSNLPYSYVSLPLRNAAVIADRIRVSVEKDLGEKVVVMIIDTDKTYSFRNLHFTPRPQPIRGIRGDGGFVAYFLGRSLKLAKRATPIAISGSNISIEQALQIAEAANRARGYGAGRNVWDMVEAFSVSLTDVTWEMLERIEHKPIVIVRRMKKH